MANSSGFPSWLQTSIKAGGWTAAVVAVWFGIAQPMREDFRDFKTQIGGDLKEVKGELKTLNDTIVAAVRERITRLEQKADDAERRLAALESGPK